LQSLFDKPLPTADSQAAGYYLLKDRNSSPSKLKQKESRKNTVKNELIKPLLKKECPPESD